MNTLYHFFIIKTKKPQLCPVTIFHIAYKKTLFCPTHTELIPRTRSKVIAGLQFANKTIYISMRSVAVCSYLLSTVFLKPEYNPCAVSAKTIPEAVANQFTPSKYNAPKIPKRIAIIGINLELTPALFIPSQIAIIKTTIELDCKNTSILFI